MRAGILRAALAVGGARIAGMALGLAVTIVIGRGLGPEGLGIYGYAVIVLGLLTVPVSYGWGTLLLRRVAAATHEARWAEPRGMVIRGTQLAAVVVLIAMLAAVSSNLARPWLGTAFSLTVLALLAAVLFLDQISALRLAVLRGLDHPVWGQLPEMLVRPGVILAALVGVLGMGRALTLEHAFWAFATASLAGALVGTAVLWRKQPAAWREAAPAFDTRNWVASAALLAGNSGLVMLNAYVDVLILGVLGTMEDVGVYRIATQVALLSGFGYTALNMLASPRFAFLRAKGDVRLLQQSAVFMARLALLGALPLPILFLFLGPRILEWVFGSAFVAAQGPMFPLFLGQLVNAAVGMASALLIMSGREAPLLRLTLVAMILNAALSMLLIPSMGAMGAALANMTATSLWNLAIWVLVMRTTRVDTSVLGLRLAPGGSQP